VRVSLRRAAICRTIPTVALALAAACLPSTAARADTNRSSIAVPVTGTQGVAAPYPSRLVVDARTGLGAQATFQIVLHGVTHPCPEDLAILLVRNATDKFLLMSHAGGCRPLQGTNLKFANDGVPLPDTQATTPAYGLSLAIGPSNYGAPPAFPAPAPSGPYTPGMPFVNVPLSGTWHLYVMDTGGTQRGVIAGGWSLLYGTDIVKTSAQVNVALPANTSDSAPPSPAGVYPITFDLNDVPATTPVTLARIDVTLDHTCPDDIRMGLQSPTGTTVILMANVGGCFDLVPGTVLQFHDGGAAMPDQAAIASGVFRPTAVLASGLLAPAPPGPYATTLAAFIGEPARGTWRLWAMDDLGGDIGHIATATLTLRTEVEPEFQLTTPPATSTQPFVRVRGTLLGAANAAVTWRVINGGSFYDAGPFRPDPEIPNGFVADIPVKRGANDIQYVALSTQGFSIASSQAVAVNEFTYSFAEGATGGFFDLDLTMANPTGVAAPIRMDFLPEGGAPIPVTDSIAGNTPLQVSVDGVVTGAVSSVIHSTDAVPLAAERTMIWDTTGYGGHGGTAVAPDRRWLFAEGSQGFFNTFVLLANDNTTDASVLLDFLVEGGQVVSVPVTVPAKARRTIFAGDVPALVNRSFSIDIESTIPIIAERAMYLPGPRVFEGGHESAGVNSPSRVWFLAEGATGSFFDCFVLLGNPSPIPAHATITYLLPSGATIVRTVTIPATSRVTINVETVDPALANADVSTTIVSDVGIVAERAMYWPAFSLGWREAHNSFGVTESAMRWGLADGRIGGPRTFQTFVLLANPNPHPAEVDVRFLKTGSVASRSYVLAPFSRRSIFVNSEVPELGDGQFSVDVQVRNFQSIAVEKALYWNSGTEVFAGGTNVTATRLPPP
jgi:subtilisin-like proprotein convertase family protein